MKLRACGAVLGLAVALLGHTACAQPAEHSVAASLHPTITFDFVRNVAGAPVPKYTLTIHQDGTANYAGEAAPPTTRYGPPASTEAIPFQRELHLTATTTAHIFDLAGQLDHFKRDCASSAKNIADTGTKTFSYNGLDAQGSCTYNYTEIKELASLTQVIQGIAETLDFGRELARLHRYDRLGLDPAMISLTQEVKDGRALEIGTIGDTLRGIAEDPDVLARVRSKASALLVQAALAQ